MKNTSNFEILFKDSPGSFLVEDAIMIQEEKLLRFSYYEDGEYAGDKWYPIANIYRVERIVEKDNDVQ